MQSMIYTIDGRMAALREQLQRSVAEKVLSVYSVYSVHSAMVRHFEPLKPGFRRKKKLQSGKRNERSNSNAKGSSGDARTLLLCCLVTGILTVVQRHS